MTTRKSGKQLREVYRDAVIKVEKIEKQILARLQQLINIHPDAVVGFKPDGNMTPMQAHEINDCFDGGDEYTEPDLNAKVALKYIENIEKWVSDNHPHRQTTIDFN